MDDQFEKFTDATIEDVVQNPHHYGMPTFEEYVKNRDKYLGRKDDWFSAVDKGSSILSRRVKKHIYKVHGVTCESLEQAERIAGEMGLDAWKLVPKPQVIDVGGGWCNLEVNLVDPTLEKEPVDAKI